MSSATNKYGVLALLLCSTIWGFAFSAQSAGMEHMGPCAFNAVRSVIGAVALMLSLPLLDIINKRKPSIWGSANSAEARRALFIGSFFSGLTLGIASLCQQIGILHASVGKAGFLTALYIILVPILGIFIGQKTSPIVWISAVIALFGMTLLCNLTLDSGFTSGDYWLLACAFMFAIQILVVARYVPKTDCVRLSCLQFVIVAIISFLAMPFFHEKNLLDGIRLSIGPLLFCGVLSSGVAYTLQNVGQKYVHPVVATLLMSLESVFSALGGWLCLNQRLSTKELVGCLVIFVAVILAQIPIDILKFKRIKHS